MEEKNRALLIDGVESLKERIDKQGEVLEELVLETQCMNDVLKVFDKILNEDEVELMEGDFKHEKSN